jgi:hypothetical protein
MRMGKSGIIHFGNVRAFDKDLWRYACDWAIPRLRKGSFWATGLAPKAAHDQAGLF